MDKPERSSYNSIDFAGWRKLKSLEISPKFQRRAVWTKPAQSYLIDTLILGFPVPPIFIRVKQSADGSKSIREIVDGQQRLRALLDFIDGGYALSWSVKSPYGGKTFDELHELAFLRIFGSWESFLEEVFKRQLCGYTKAGAQEALVAGQSYSKTLNDAEFRMLNGRKYVSWYSPSDVVGRCRKFFTSSNLEFVIASANTILSDQSATRHQIAHVQPHATTQFDVLTMRLTGKQFGRSRPGKFLRYVEPTLGHSWFQQFSIQLRNLALQVAG